MRQPTMSRLACAALAAALAAAAAPAATAGAAQGAAGDRFEKAGERGGVSRYVLKANGLEVLVKEDHSAPVATFLVHYRVGSRNEAVGHTGATHLLEHMLFKGTPEHSRAKGTQIAALLERLGADYNASTWYDRTNYHQVVPSDQLEPVARMEADRMRNSLILDEDRQSEMTVVRNELELSDSDPLSVLDVQMWATAFREHPYHHPTIGWRSDVEGVPTARLKAFYDTYYWPNNATVVVAGDVTQASALALVDRHFGSIPRSPAPIPDVYTTEPEQQGERRFVVRRAGQDGIVMFGFRTPGASSPDTPALAVLSRLLSSGRSSRLYRALVESQIASEVASSETRFRDPGIFQVYARVMPESSHERAEREILAQVERVRGEAPPAAEVEKAKRVAETEIVFSREGAYNATKQMSEALAAADWNWYFDFPEAVRRVTPADVQRVARQYIRPSRMTAGWFVPTGEGAADDFKVAGQGALKSPALHHPRGAQDREAPSGGAPAGRAAASSFAARTLREELPGGAAVLALENHADPTVAVLARVGAGSAFGPADNRLLADVTARMLRRGTKKRDALRFASDVESLGAELDVSASAFTVDVEARALSRDTRAVLEAVAEMLREPAFPAPELDKVKAEIAAEIRQAQDSTFDQARRRLTQLTLPATHPHYQEPYADALAALERVTLADVRKFYESTYVLRGLRLIVVGDVDARAVAADARRLFGGRDAIPGGILGGRPVQPRAAARESVVVKDKSSADVIIGLPGTLTRRDPDFFAASIANAILGQSTLSSRFGVRVRDREGLTYGIGSRFWEAGPVDGLWYVTLTVAPENIDKAIASTVDELERALREGVTQAEVDDYKSSFVGYFKVSLATNAGIAERLAEAELYGFGPSYLDEYPALVRRVTLADVNAALRKHVVPGKLVTVVAGPAAK
jgi:zinc protease